MDLQVCLTADSMLALPCSSVDCMEIRCSGVCGKALTIKGCFGLGESFVLLCEF